MTSMLTLRDQAAGREVDDTSHDTHQPIDVSPKEEQVEQAPASRG